MRTVGCLECTESTLRRRDFLRVGSLSLLGCSLTQYLQLRTLMAGTKEKKSKAQACILLWLEGGPSHVDTWDPKANSNFKPIATNVAGIQISELLPQVAKQMDKLSIVRSMHTEEDNHPQGTYYALTGHRPNPAMQFPSFGSIISKETGPRNNVPPYVLTPQWDKEKQYEISLDRIQDRRSFLKIWDSFHRQKVEIAEYASMDTFTEQALNMILSPAVRDAFDLSKESDKTKETYGRDSFGQSVLLARRLVEAGSRFVTAAGFPFNAWDSHGENDKNHRDKLVPVLDRGLSTLLEDLKQRGLLESTVVIAMGEFGRTPHLNPNFGRDHWPHCWSLVLGGGGIQGGQVIGASDERGGYVAEQMTTMGDVFATIYKAFGIDWEKTYMSPIGRPIKIANSIEDKTGSPIAALV
jgi:uncharacterized protein (DUF1501 family)